MIAPVVRVVTADVVRLATSRAAYTAFAHYFAEITSLEEELSMSARLVTMNDLYSFDPDKHIEIERFTDIIGRNFKQPKEGLGYDHSPSAHMWRTILWPTRFL